MRIGLDVDGVLYDYDRTVRYMLRTMRGHKDNPVLQKEATSWTSTQEAVSKHDWQWVWSKGVKLGLFRYGHLYTGAIEGVRALSDLGSISIITHRPASAVADTLDWLAYLRLPFKEVYLLTEGQSKSSVPHCEMYVDDKPENIEDFIKNVGIAAELGAICLWDRPWNRDYKEPESEYPLSFRVKSWDTVVDLAKAVLGKG